VHQRAALAGRQVGDLDDAPFADRRDEDNGARVIDELRLTESLALCRINL
jgi:hypothetical protein